eukprot:8653488-Pyramimonas_sp.AAC.1
METAIMVDVLRRGGASVTVASVETDLVLSELLGSTSLCRVRRYNKLRHRHLRHVFPCDSAPWLAT